MDKLQTQSYDKLIIYILLSVRIYVNFEHCSKQLK